MEAISKSGPIPMFIMEFKILGSFNEGLVGRKRVPDNINEVRVRGPHGFHPEKVYPWKGYLEDVN